ncbi:nucleotidyltransferase family protein [Parablautia muri]|uniref:Nucleotidyltransferase domain-containing protein n=1 Tax=Parablautia muri TaxID=2320879 RepID=A0A9X5BE77_9FIRM|nr:nucleotidyltransferase domain-containing protein [Parablautia muri]NBJ91978.1 nucleotidyltransferase domain-containing protein [Parablautia muri]
MQAEEVIAKVAQLCWKYSAEQGILFGSRAKGTALARSDIDIAVSGVDDFFAFQEEVENLPTLFSVDIVDMDTCTNPLLLEEIRKYGKKIYEKVPVL